MSTFTDQVGAILWKDLISELRTRDLLGGMVLFGVLVLLVFNFAFDLRIDNVAAVAPGILWVAFTFAGMLGLARSFVQEKDRGAIDGLLAAPIDRGAIYLAKFLGNVIFMSVVEAVCLPLFTVFFNFGVINVDVVAITFLGTCGFAAVGTLFSAMAANTRARDILLPLLVFPICIPVVIAAVEATASTFGGSPPDTRWRWLALLGAFDVIFAVVCFVVFDVVVEE